MFKVQDLLSYAWPSISKIAARAFCQEALEMYPVKGDIQPPFGVVKRTVEGKRAC